jgi:hypothetical protein
MIENQQILDMFGDLCKQLALEVMQIETQQSCLTFKALMGKGLSIVDKEYLIKIIDIISNNQIQYSIPKMIKVWCIRGRVDSIAVFEEYKELINRNFKAIIENGK